MKIGFRKRAMSIVLCATMLIAVLCIAPATAAAAATDDGLTYTIANEELLIISPDAQNSMSKRFSRERSMTLFSLLFYCPYAGTLCIPIKRNEVPP